MTPLDAALKYAALGWRVFPLHHAERGQCSCGKTDCRNAAKHPRTPNGLHDATTDATTVLAWWKRWPKANIGVATGKGSGIFVLDVDGPQGEASIAGRPLASGPVATTGRGRHRYHWHPGADLPNFTRRLPGIDGRGDGGYVVAPPSIHANGTPYAWETAPWDADPPEAPDWILELFRTDAPRTTAIATAPAAGEPMHEGPAWQRAMYFDIPEGSRNDALTRVAGHFLGLSLPESEVVGILEAVNAARCKPPLELEEVETIARSVARRERRKQASTDPDAIARLEQAGVPDDEVQAARLENLSRTLGIGIQRVVKFDRDPPAYQLTADGQGVPLGSVDALLEYRALRRAVAQATGRLVRPVTKEAWPGVSRLLLDACEVLEVEEATAAGTVRRWVSDYLEAWEATASEPWAAAALERRPFRHRNRVLVNLAHLHQHVTNRLQEKTPMSDLATQLRVCGAEPLSLKATAGGKSAAVRAWRLPADIVTQAAWLHQVTGENDEA